MINEPTKGNTVLDLLVANRGKLLENVKVKGSLDHNDHETVVSKILIGVSKTNSRITTLDFRREDCSVFRDLLGRIMRETALEGRGAK